MTYLGNSPGSSPSIVVSEYIATAGQTTFSASYYEYVQVYLNGMLLSASDYVANDGSTVVLAVGANAGDVILINGYEVGLQGIKGDTGEQGLKGDKGDTGDVGPQGVKGDTGEVSLSQLTTALSTKQDTLVSGTNIKTINSTTILGSGNIVTGDVTLTGTQTLTNKTITGLKETSVAMGANDIDLSLGNLFTKTITGATTLTVSNVPASGTVGYFILKLTNGGAGAVTYPTGTKWSKGTAPTLTASGIDLLRFVTIDGGTRWEASRIQEDSK